MVNLAVVLGVGDWGSGEPFDDESYPPVAAPCQRSAGSPTSPPLFILTCHPSGRDNDAFFLLSFLFFFFPASSNSSALISSSLVD